MVREKPLLRRLRNKLVLLLLVYFAGYATAVYHLVPAPENKADMIYGSSFAHSDSRSDELVISFSKGLHQCVTFSKWAALRTADAIKQAYDQRKLQTDS